MLNGSASPRLAGNSWSALQRCVHVWHRVASVAVQWPAGEVHLICSKCGYQHTARFRLPRGAR